MQGMHISNSICVIVSSLCVFNNNTIITMAHIRQRKCVMDKTGITYRRLHWNYWNSILKDIFGGKKPQKEEEMA